MPDRSACASDEQRVFSSTVIVRGCASAEDRAEKIKEMADRGVVVQHCPKCGSALNISECFPLSEIACPECHERMKVLERFGHFVLLSVLGQGGMGCVCRAFDRKLERDVALKMIRNEHMNDPEYISQLQSEATCMAQVAHPNVVRVYSTGIENGIYFIAMEIVTGGTVAKLMEHERIPEIKTLNIAIQVAEGLSAAVRAGLLHRDIKPGNILVADGPQYKMADFGLALTVQQASKAGGDVWGTPEYVAPEKILRLGEDVRSDIYSLGAALFHMLTGRRLFDGATASEVALKHVESKPLSLQTFAPEVSDEFSAIIAQMLEKEPGERQQSYEELLAQLRYVQTKIEAGATKRQQIRGSMELQQVEEQKSSALIVAMILGAVVIVGLCVFFQTRKGETTGQGIVGRKEEMVEPSSKPQAEPQPKLQPMPPSKAVSAPSALASAPLPASPVQDEALARFPTPQILFQDASSFTTSDPSHAKRMEGNNPPCAVVFACQSGPEDSKLAKSIIWRIPNEIKQGNIVMVTFWARITEPYLNPDGAKFEVMLESVESKPRRSFSRRIGLTKKWRKYYMPFKANRDVAANQLKYEFRFGDQPVSFQIGDPMVLNFGSTVKFEDLPNTHNSTYPR